MGLVPPEWLHWIYESIQQKRPKELIISTLVENGLESGVSEKIVRTTMKKGLLVARENLVSERWVK